MIVKNLATIDAEPFSPKPAQFDSITGRNRCSASIAACSPGHVVAANVLTIQFN